MYFQRQKPSSDDHEEAQSMKMKLSVLPLLMLPTVAAAEMLMMDESVASAPSGATTAIAQIQPMPTAKEIWKGNKGDSLRTAIQQWADKAHWNVVWDTKIDYPLLAPVTFAGRFDEAVAQFVRLYDGAERPLVVDIQPQQTLIYITDRMAGR